MGGIFLRGRAALVFTAILAGFSNAQVAQASDAEKVCGGPHGVLALPDDVVKGFTLNDQYKIDMDRPSLMDLISGSAEHNLAVRSPSVVMNAYQLVASWIHSVPKVRAVNPGFDGGYVDVYPVLSKPLAVNSGRHIVWQFPAVSAFVNAIEAGARGDGSRVKVPMFVGPAGTGKTEFLDIMNEVGKNLSKGEAARQMWTFEFINLSGIPELVPALNLQTDSAGKIFEHPLQPLVYESPIVLLPKPYQDAVIKMAAGKAQSLSGYAPSPVLKASPPTEHIVRAILTHYLAEKDARSLSPEQVVQILSKHVRLKRYFPGEDGQRAKIDAQGKDVDYGGLFFTPNPFLLTQFGPGHPLSYYYNGTVLRGQGTITALDEFLRNEEALRDVFLGIQESRQVGRGGAPIIPVDTVFIAATNDESVDKVKGQGTAKAQLDRLRMVPMRLETHPVGIAHTMLLMKNMKTVLQQPLRAPAAGEETSEVAKLEPGNLDDLFKLPETIRQPAIGPDGRYSIYIQVGEKEEPVLLAPHTLMNIALTVAATRIKTNVEQAAKLGVFKVITDSLFRDTTTRLKAMLGEVPMNEAQARELGRLSRLMKEGTSGISQRDAANIWLTEVINEARKPGNANTVTPQIVKRVFERLLEEGELKPPTNQARLEWINDINLIERHFIVPRIIKDVYRALGQSTNSVDQIHDEIMKELLAIKSDPSARAYQDGEGTHPIDRERLAIIENIYRMENGRAIALDELVDFAKDYGRTGGGRSMTLKAAIEISLARDAMKFINARDLAGGSKTPGSLTGDKSMRVLEVMHTMRTQFGYNDAATKAAFQLFYEDQISRQQVEQQQ